MPAGKGPVRAVLTMSVPAQSASEFEKEWVRVADWVQAQPGCLRQTLAVLGDTDPMYQITSDWTDASTYELFERSSRQDTQTAGLRRLRTDVRMQVFTIIEHKEPS